jgi:hypothetical protein
MPLVRRRDPFDHRAAIRDDSITVADITTGETLRVNGGSRDDTAGLGDPAKSFAVPPVVSSVETVL